MKAIQEALRRSITDWKAMRAKLAEKGAPAEGAPTSEFPSLLDDIAPEGTLEITENGEYDVTEYATANVNVASSGGGASVETCTVTINSYKGVELYYSFPTDGIVLETITSKTITCVKNTIFICKGVNISTGTEIVEYSESITHILGSGDIVIFTVTGDGALTICFNADGY